MESNDTHIAWVSNLDEKFQSLTGPYGRTRPVGRSSNISINSSWAILSKLSKKIIGCESGRFFASVLYIFSWFDHITLTTWLRVNQWFDWPEIYRAHLLWVKKATDNKIIVIWPLTSKNERHSDVRPMKRKIKKIFNVV